MFEISQKIRTPPPEPALFPSYVLGIKEFAKPRNEHLYIPVAGDSLDLTRYVKANIKRAHKKSKTANFEVEQMNDIQELKNSPIYAMSLGSKELYHSNVWAWLIETDPSFAKVFGFDDDIVRRIKKVGREDGGRDLSLYLDSDDKNNASVIVIENKLKAIPNIEQLKKYQEGLNGRFYTGVLTGIILPAIADENGLVEVNGKRWRLIEYPIIAERILEIARSSEVYTIKKSLPAIEEYATNILHMSAIVQDYSQETIEPVWEGDLDDLGLQDLINKVRGSRFMRYFDDRYKNGDHDFSNPKFQYWQSFHNKKNTLDFRFVSEEGFVIGIQIEGNQFRRVVQVSNKTPNKISHDELFKRYRDVWFDCGYFGKKSDKSRCINWPKALSPVSTLMTGTHCKYVTDEYCFVYQYATLNKEDMQYQNLHRLILDNLAVAEEIFESNQ